MNRFKGLFYGIISGASFGLIPLFTLPLISSSCATDTILFYRFSLASIVIAVIMLIRGDKFAISLAELLRILLLGLLYMCSALFLLWGYEYMPAGVATTIHFLYPVLVVLVMMIAYGERPSIPNIGAIMLSVIGVALLSAGDNTSGAIEPLPLLIVVGSALAYALYIVALKKIKLGRLGGLKLTFYVLLSTAVLFAIKSVLTDGKIAPIESIDNLVNLLLLAIVPTVLSNFTLVEAVKLIGSSRTSILGACEPLTAVAVGVLIFGEAMSMPLAIGMTLIVASVVTVVWVGRK